MHRLSAHREQGSRRVRPQQEGLPLEQQDAVCDADAHHQGVPDRLCDRGGLYVVYSYGPHFPLALFDYDAGKWFHNTDKYSSTTSRHFSHVGAYSLGDGRSSEFLRSLINHGGLVNAVAARLDETNHHATA